MGNLNTKKGPEPRLYRRTDRQVQPEEKAIAQGRRRRRIEDILEASRLEREWAGDNFEQRAH